MILVEKHIIKKTHKYFKTCDKVCFESKNIYNSCLYIIRKQYEKDGSYPQKLYSIISKSDVWKNNPNGTKVSNQTRILVEQNYKAFFKIHKEYIKNPSKFKGRPNPPRYKDGNHGRVVSTYTNESISKKEFKKSGRILLSKTNIYISTSVKDFDSIKQVKIVPHGNHYTIFVIYEKEVKQLKEIGNVASIDLGLNNLTTITYLIDGVKPMIFNGRPLKSINQYYNKKKAHFQSKLKGEKKTSNKIQNLTLKRNNKINDYLHKISKHIVDNLISNNVSYLIIGKNDGWKNSINIGKKNNQNFVQIPFNKLLDMITYKANLNAIEVKLTEESYTSKCSFLDLEEVKKHETYLGKRIKRGMFKASDGRLINADVNGAFNIMRKAIPEAFTHEGIEGLAVIPKKMSLTLS